MDVYQLILERGTLGALKYANKIDSTNYVLASEIEDAVRELCTISSKINLGRIKLAQSLPSPEVQYYNPPSYNETQQTNTTTPQSENPYLGVPKSEYTNLGQGAYSLLKAFINAQKLVQTFFQVKVEKQQQLAKSLLEASDINGLTKDLKLLFKDNPKILKYLEKGLENLFPNELRKFFAAKELVKSSPEATEIFKALNQMYIKLSAKTVGFYVKDADELLKLYKAKFPTDPNLVKFESIINVNSKKLLEKTLEEVTQQSGEELSKQYAKGVGKDVVEDVAEKAAGQAAKGTGKELAEEVSEKIAKGPIFSKVEMLFGLIAKRIPAAAKPLAVILKFNKIIPYVGALIETGDLAWNIYRDLQNGQLSNKTICLVLSTIMSWISSSAFVANIATGGAATPLVLAQMALSTIISLGCSFLAKSSDQLKEEREQNYKDLNAANINKYKTTIQTRDLNKEDLHLIDDIIRNSKTESELDNKIQSAISGKKFFDPAKALAMIQKQMDQKGLGKELKWSIFDYF